MEDEKGLSEMDKLVGEQVARELKRIDSHVKENHKALAETVQRQEKEMRELGGVTTQTKAALAKLEETYANQVAELKGYHNDLTGKIQELKEVQAEMEDERKEMQARRALLNAGAGAKSVGEAFEGNELWNNWEVESQTNSPRIKLGRIDDWKVRGAKSRKDITGGASLNAVLGITNWQDIYGEPVIENEHLRAYMNVESASGHSVAYVRRTAFANNAAFQAAEGDLKAVSNHTFQDFDAKACVLAHRSTISKQQARSTSTVVNYVQNDLLNGLYHVESRQILFGDGSTGNIEGITNVDGIQNYVRGVAGDTKIDALRRSETQLQGIYMRGDLYVVNHEDWEAMELTKDDDKRYLWVSVQEGGTARMWRKPIFVTPAMSQGDFINGAFRVGATLLDFENAGVQIFTQHADYPARNLLLILAEETIGLAVMVPAAFVVGNYTSVGSGSGYVAP